MRISRRLSWKIALVSIVVWASAGLACSGANEGSEAGPVEVDLEMPPDAPGAFRLSGAVETQLDAQSADLLQPRDTDEIRLRMGGVSSDDCENVNLNVYFPVTEGETGTFESIKTPQFTCGSAQYVPSDAVRTTVETFSDGRFVGALEGTFDLERAGGEDTPVDPPMEVEVKFDFEYDE